MMYQEKIGEYLLRMEEMSSCQVENILLRQQCGDRRRFGEIAVDLRYINRQALETCLSGSGLPLWSNTSDEKGPESVFPEQSTLSSRES